MRRIAQPGRATIKIPLFANSLVLFILGMLGFDWAERSKDLTRSWSVAALKRTETINADTSMTYSVAA